MSNLQIKVNLTKIPGAHFVELNGKNGPVKCIVMPVEDCNLFTGEKGVYLDLTAYEYKEQKFADSHFIKPNIKKEVYSAMTKEQQNAIVVCGGIQPLKAKEMEAATTSEFTPPQGGEGSDLPF